MLKSACRGSSTAGRLRCLLWALLPAALYLLPRDFIFSGEHTLCLWRHLFGVECWGCGMTRAILSLAYFDFEGAWNYNPRVVVVAPLLLYLWGKRLWRYAVAGRLLH